MFVEQGDSFFFSYKAQIFSLFLLMFGVGIVQAEQTTGGPEEHGVTKGNIPKDGSQV